MKTIVVSSDRIINPMFFIALNALQAEKIPVPVLKQLRRITKKLREEHTELKADTMEFRSGCFDLKTYDEKQLNCLLMAKSEESRVEMFKEYKFTPEKIAQFKNEFNEFDKKCIELGKTPCEIPFPKVILPDDFEFRTDFATLLEDILDLD